MNIEHIFCRDSKQNSCIIKQSCFAALKDRGIWWSRNSCFFRCLGRSHKINRIVSSPLLALGVGHSFAVVIQRMHFQTPASLHHPSPLHSSSAISEFEKGVAIPIRIVCANYFRRMVKKKSLRPSIGWEDIGEVITQMTV